MQAQRVLSLLLVYVIAFGLALPLTQDASRKTNTRTRCAVSHADATKHFNNTLKLMHHLNQETPLPTDTRRRAVLSVDTYVHVISDLTSATMVNKTAVLDQMKVLNNAYNPLGISFNLVLTTLTVEPEWAVASGSDMLAAKQALRQGLYSSLNLYFHTNLTGNILGTCTLPSSVPDGADQSLYTADGCNMHAGTMPGGSFDGYNSGMTAVHEVGHWFGLLHTFEGDSCTGDGDHIADTRQESIQTSGCPISPVKNSCPGIPGVDPIHNFMDYSDDACYESFTTLQAQRMLNMWTEYRSGNS